MMWVVIVHNLREGGESESDHLSSPSNDNRMSITEAQLLFQKSNLEGGAIKQHNFQSAVQPKFLKI